jgi:flagellar motor protein MotB
VIKKEVIEEKMSKTGNILKETKNDSKSNSQEEKNLSISKTEIVPKEEETADILSEETLDNLGKAPNGEDLYSLLELHAKLESIQDAMVLEKVVLAIQETGMYNVGETTFDFDLCVLDSKTVRQIENFISNNAVSAM